MFFWNTVMIISINQLNSKVEINYTEIASPIFCWFPVIQIEVNFKYIELNSSQHTPDIQVSIFTTNWNPNSSIINTVNTVYCKTEICTYSPNLPSVISTSDLSKIFTFVTKLWMKFTFRFFQVHFIYQLY